MTDLPSSVEPWVLMILGTISALLTLVPMLAKLIPPSGTPPKTTWDDWPVTVQALQYKLHEEKPAALAYCCDQGEIAWPYPCPWHGEHNPRTTRPDAFMDSVADHFVAPLDRAEP